MIVPRCQKNDTLTSKALEFWFRNKLLFKGQRHCTRMPLWYNSLRPSSHICTPLYTSHSLKWAKTNQRSLSSEKQGAAKTSCQTGKEDKMVRCIPAGNSLFSLGCSTQPRLKHLQEMLPSTIAFWLLCYPTHHAMCCSGKVWRWQSYLH